MLVEELMEAAVKSCRRGESLHAVAKRMWEGDLGAVPVIDEQNRPIGMITDRDICMTAYFDNRPLSEMSVDALVRERPLSVKRTDQVAQAIRIMRERQVRRVPVVEDDGTLAGVLSLGDLARAAGGRSQGLGNEEIATTLAAISAPRGRSAADTAGRIRPQAQPTISPSTARLPAEQNKRAARLS